MEAKVKIYNINHNSGRNIWKFNDAAYEMINSDRVVIDPMNLRIRIPNYDDNKTYKLCRTKCRPKYKNKTYEYDHTWHGVSVTHVFDKDISGDYELERDGDWLMLNKCEN